MEYVKICSLVAFITRDHNNTSIQKHLVYFPNAIVLHLQNTVIWLLCFFHKYFKNKPISLPLSIRHCCIFKRKNSLYVFLHIYSP